MNSPAFSLLRQPPTANAMEKEAVLPEEKSRIARTRHLAFEQQAEPIDFVGVCILAEPTVGPAVSAERGGPSPQCLPKENKRGRVQEELVKVAVVYRNPQP